MSESLIKRAARRAGSLGVLGALSSSELDALQYAWALNARPGQLPPEGDWLTWLLLAGRGFGKSRTGAEWSRSKAIAMPGSHGALIAPTAADTRDVMVKALLECSDPAERVAYEPSKRRLTWGNGSSATLYSAEEPDRLRGPQHHWAWCDEIAAWAYPDDVWDMLMMTLRLGERPQVVASTTPRPIALVRRLVKDPSSVITRGSTFDNVDNLSPAFLATVRERYDGTRLGRQELYAEILDDTPGALWTRALVEAKRIRPHEAPQFVRRVVAVDPAGSHRKTSDETGIVEVATAWCACNGKRELHAFVLGDRSGRFSPDEAARVAVRAYQDGKADRMVVETNFGGDMFASLVKTTGESIAVRSVVASRGKQVRAEPVAALYEQGKVHHVGSFTSLEDQMCTYSPTDASGSPDRMDALVWALTDTMTSSGMAQFIEAMNKAKAA